MATKWTNSVTMSRVRENDLWSPWGRGTPRRTPRIELMYIRHNAQRAKEVRLMAREEVGQETRADPHTTNGALAILSPRNAVSKERKSSRLVALGVGADWELGLKDDGSRLEGNGVRWCGSDSPAGRGSPGKTGYQGSTSPQARSPILKREWSAGRGPSKKKTYGSPKSDLDDPTESSLTAKRQTRIAPLKLPMASPRRQGAVTFRSSMDAPVSPWGKAGSVIEPLDLNSPSLVLPMQRSPKRVSIHNSGETTHRSTIRHFQWPRSLDEDSAWQVLSKKLVRRARKGAGTLAFAAAAETAFSGLGQQLKMATSLEKRGQHLTKIPRQWLNIHLLRISLKECDLDNLPTHIGNSVPHLEQLFLDHNRLTSLPESIQVMENLRDLGLTANSFKVFPVVIGKLANLQILSLQNNKLEFIPPCIGYCKSMKGLYFTRNPLRSISLAVGLLHDLHSLTLDVTSELRQPPPAVAKMGFEFMHEFLSIHMHNATVLFRNELRKSFLKCKAAFLKFDVDGDGQLDQVEVRAALETLKVNIDYFDDLWVCLDQDNSGSVTYDEFFENMMQTQHETLRDPREELNEVTSADADEIQSAFQNLNTLTKPSVLKLSSSPSSPKAGKLATIPQRQRLLELD